MATLSVVRGVVVGLALATSSHAAAEPVDPWRAVIAEASARFDVPATWIERVVRAESDGRTTRDGRPTTSRAGAMGLMQLMPANWTALQTALALGRNPHDPHDNIIAGTAYLRAMYDRFGYPGLFAAYNAGPGRYARHRATGRPLPRETRAYLVSVAGQGDPWQDPPVERRRGSIFVALGAVDPVAAAPRAAGSASLFVTLSAH